MNQTYGHDWNRLPEDVTGHAMAGPFTHADGRRCYFHSRLGRWTTDHPEDIDGESVPVGCLRNTHPIAADLLRPDMVWEERPVIPMKAGDVVVWRRNTSPPVYVRITFINEVHAVADVTVNPGMGSRVASLRDLYPVE
jgi:hypothetical protein